MKKLLILLLLPTLAWGASESHTAGTGAGFSWTNPTNAQGAGDNNCATYNGTGQDYLVGHNFGFTTIQTTDIVDSINVTLDCYGTDSKSGGRTMDIQLGKTGTSAPTGTAYTFIATLGANCAASGDVAANGHVLWGTTWTGTEIRSSNFAVWLRDTDVTAAELGIDAITVTVYYHSPSNNRRRIELQRLLIGE